MKNGLAKIMKKWSRKFEVAGRSGGKGVILGPGCVIDPSTPEERLELVYRTVLETVR